MTTPAQAGAALAAQRKLYDKRCRQCGEAFTGTIRAVYCGRPCKDQAAYERRVKG